MPQGGGFSIQFPPAYVIYIEQRPSVDGVVATFPNGINLVDLRPIPKQPILIDSVPGLLFPDTRCAPYGSSILYLVRESMAYRITVETHAAFQEVSASVMDLLSTGPDGAQDTFSVAISFERTTSAR